MKRLAVLSAFAIHLAVGGICSMPMDQAMAAGPDEGMAMSMAHDCDDCSHVGAHADSAPAGCDGHCITQGNDAAAVTTPSIQPLTAAALPSVPAVQETETALVAAPPPDASPSPGETPLTGTVILVE